MDEGQKDPLSWRELEILQLVASGASNKQIAARLSISTNTVKVHLRNIYRKLDVSSRTEASFVATQKGLIRLAEALPGTEAASMLAPEESAGRASGTRRALISPLVMVGSMVFLAIGLFLLFGLQGSPLRGNIAEAPTVADSRWKPIADLPTARSHLAIATLGGRIYAAGGRTASGPTDVLERYDPETDSWETLARKPTPVSDARAVALGGLLYLPGGLLRDGLPTAALEVYDPDANSWSSMRPMPRPLSGYAMTAFEGKVYLFGGWDGHRTVNLAIAYDPETDTWKELSPMPTARAFAGAAVVRSEGGILVMGGSLDDQALARTEVFYPSGQGGGRPGIWREGLPLPGPQQHVRCKGLADIVFVFGQNGEGQVSLLAYVPQANKWEQHQVPFPGPLGGAGLAAVGTNLYFIGGEDDGHPASAGYLYQAIYTVLLPAVE